MFFLHDTRTPGIYTLSLHDALPISQGGDRRINADESSRQALGSLGRAGADRIVGARAVALAGGEPRSVQCGDRKSTRLNSSHVRISYAVFCLKKKNKQFSYQTYRQP